ncbi:MAG: catalase [Benniella sp.]|nr:MAG: catalase [Benniella sp.]
MLASSRSLLFLRSSSSLFTRTLQNNAHNTLKVHHSLRLSRVISTSTSTFIGRRRNNMSFDTTHDVPFPITVDTALGEVLQPNEDKFATEIANAIEASIHRQVEPGKEEIARRDVHAKATGILKAEFKVDANIPARFAKGIFVPGKSYDAILRFSNASEDVHESDTRQDGRGFAMKLLNVPGPKLLDSDKEATTQDFVLINKPFFFASDPEKYVEVVSKNSSGSVLQKLTIPFTLGLRGTLIVQKLATGRIANPFQVQYFSAVPYQLGVGEGREAVKYSLKPVSDHRDPIPHHAGENYLHEEIKNSLAKGQVEFKFLVQPKVDEKQSVEDSTTEWREEEAPFFEVATLIIRPQDVDSEELVQLGERLSFNPWHSLAEHRPLGSINRARKVVYERISRVRNQINKVPQEEPASSS